MSTLNVLSEGLKITSPVMRARAVWSILKQEIDNGERREITRVLTDALKSEEDDDVRMAIVYALGQRGGDDAIGALYQCCLNDRQEVCHRALDALANISTVKSFAKLILLSQQFTDGYDRTVVRYMANLAKVIDQSPEKTQSAKAVRIIRKFGKTHYSDHVRFTAEVLLGTRGLRLIP